MIEKNITLELKLPMQKDVCYVNKRTIVEKDDHYYVFLLNEKGTCNVAEVKIGESFGDNVIIKEGLEGGENAVIQE